MGCLKLTYETEFCLSLAGEHKQTLGRRKKRAGTYKYKFQEQERQDELGLNWDSFKWRNYDPAIGRFMSIDPLSEKYVHNGVYNFSENRVIDARELEGLEAVLIVDKGNYAKADVGHTFVVTGTGKNMTAYTYGRWSGTNPNSSGSHTPLNNGNGVLVKLTGKEAMAEVQKYVSHGAQAFEITNANEGKVKQNLEKQFNSTDKTPETGKYKGDERAHVIDNYDLTDNNCTTKSLDAVSAGLNGGNVTYDRTVIAGGFPVIATDSTKGTYSPNQLGNQLYQATNDPKSGVENVTDRFKPTTTK